jgi:hypothetical protein
MFMEFPFSFIWDFEKKTIEVKFLSEQLSLEHFEMLGHAVLYAATEFRADVERGFLLDNENLPQFSN